MLDRRAEPVGARIHDEMPDHAAQHSARDRHDHPGKGGSQQSADGERCPEMPWQEPGDVPRHRVQVVRGDEEILWSCDTVDEADSEIEPVRVLEHAGESLSSGILILPAALGALGEPGAHEFDRPVGEGLTARVGDFGGGRHVHETIPPGPGRAERLFVSSVQA